MWLMEVIGLDNSLAPKGNKPNDGQIQQHIYAALEGDGLIRSDKEKNSAILQTK